MGGYKRLRGVIWLPRSLSWALCIMISMGLRLGSGGRFGWFRGEAGGALLRAELEEDDVLERVQVWR